MKYKLLCLLLVCAISTLVVGARVQWQPTVANEGTDKAAMLLAAQKGWQSIDTTTAAGDEPNNLAVTERTYLTVIAAAEGGDDEIEYLQVDPSWVGVQFECIGITDNSDITYQIYFGTLANDTDCTLTWAGQLEFIIGQQVSTVTDYELADQVTVTQGDWNSTWSSVSPGDGTERVASASVDLRGNDLIVAVPTVVDCNCILGAKGY